MDVSWLRSWLGASREPSRGDRDALEGLAWTGDPAWPAGLEIEWLGTAGFRLSYEGFDLLIDPYVTRVPLGAVLARRPALPEVALVRRYVPRASAVLVGHTHFDHAVDVPKLSELYGCPVFGSPSLQHLMALHGLAERATVVEPYRTYALGPFEVSFVPSVHSKLVLGLAVPFDGELTCEHLDQLAPSAYRCGLVWGIHVAVAGVTFYHQGSADLVDDAVRHRGVDYFLAGISGRSMARDYVGRVLRQLEPRVIVPTHYDDFFRPLGEPMTLIRNVDVAGFVGEVEAVSRDFTIRTLRPLEVVGGGPSGRPYGASSQGLM
jgi:L-ascorbate metabolism protein UlaG (beta-lactamase superfamily)